MKVTRSLLAATALATLTTPVLAESDNKLATEYVHGDLSVMVLGSGGPIAFAGGRASASYLVYTDGKPRILMDVGGGAYQRLAESGQNIKDLEIVLLSHLHADHTGDMTSVIKTMYFHDNLYRLGLKAKGISVPGRSNPVNVWGPGESKLPDGTLGKRYGDDVTGTLVYPSTEHYVDGHFAIPGGVERYMKAFVAGITDDDGPKGSGGPAAAFAYTAHDLNSSFGPATMQKVIDCGGDDAAETYCAADLALDPADRLHVKAIGVDHGPVPSVAYRIEYKGHVVTYSGDTGTQGGPMAFGKRNMKTISQDADLLIYDTAVMEQGDAPPNPLFHILHTAPSDIAEVAVAANAENLVLSHITPVTDPRLDEVEGIIRDNGYTGEIDVARDLKVYNVGD